MGSSPLYKQREREREDTSRQTHGLFSIFFISSKANKKDNKEGEKASDEKNATLL
jgi:hypothetical protein